ncbi:MAG: hypothetical protein JSU61_08725 [Fidelibacterota bacterium]|nr:MAG: hypothetical protein JSU61_08725 [Candidatus Neomarinimicrobiota bacterium]
MVRAFWELLDGTRHSRNYHTFDSRGNMTAKYREFSDGITSLQRFEYDNAGNLVTEHFERSDSVTGITHYDYDPAGRLITARCKGLNGWFIGVIHYEYDETGNRIGGAIDQAGKRTGHITYTYDEYGNLSTEHWDFPGVWSQSFTYEYQTAPPPTCTSSNVFIRNTGDARVIREQYDYNGTIGGPSYYEYDARGWLVKKIFVRSDDFETATTYEYDHAGILLQSFREYSNGLSAVFSYKFDGNRRLVHRAFTRSDGVLGVETYEYDLKGRLVSAVYDNFDTWLTGTITFQHTDDGRLTGGTFVGRDGFDAELSFEHDANGNVVTIHWVLSSGQTQTYTFEYEPLTSD